ncbi:MAG: hypothetical protein CMH54_05245 [Myxococcales bacterium]|nr:hypothetical protein [Myxococcales bacterium]|tara:strand:+ start:6 stop:731 length:726 start_codon:yes stop_codon:yes gene_type:complete
MSANEPNTQTWTPSTSKTRLWVGRLIAIVAVLVGITLVTILKLARPASLENRAVALYVEHVCLSKKGVSGPVLAYRLIQKEHKMDINGLIYTDEIRAILTDEKRAEELRKRIMATCPGVVSHENAQMNDHRVVNYAPRWIAEVVSEGGTVDDKWIVYEGVKKPLQPGLKQEASSIRARNMHVEIACMGRDGKSREQVRDAMPGLYKKHDLSPQDYGREVRRFLSDAVTAEAVANQIRSACK